MNDSKILLTLVGAAGASFLIYNLISADAHCLPRSTIAPKIMLLGDSLTGTASYHATVRKALLIKYPAAQITTLSYPGKGIAFIRSEGLKHVLQAKPDLVVFLAGVNDLASGRPVTYVITQLAKTYQELYEHDVPVAAVTLTPWSAHTKGRRLQSETLQVNAFIQRTPIPCSVVNSTEITGLGADGLHLTRAGGIELAKSVLKDALGVI